MADVLNLCATAVCHAQGKLAQKYFELAAQAESM
jgi:hypothetical protein